MSYFANNALSISGNYLMRRESSYTAIESSLTVMVELITLVRRPTPVFDSHLVSSNVDIE